MWTAAPDERARTEILPSAPALATPSLSRRPNMAQKNVPPRAGVFNSAQPLTTPLAAAQEMITALTDLAAAKRGLGGNPGFDPALAASRTAVDEARTRVLTQPIARPSLTP